MKVPERIYMFLKRAIVIVGFPGGSVVKNLPVDAGDAGSIAGSGRCPGGGHGNPIQYSCMENSRQRRLVSYNPWDCRE